MSSPAIASGSDRIAAAVLIAERLTERMRELSGADHHFVDSAGGIYSDRRSSERANAGTTGPAIPAVGILPSAVGSTGGSGTIVCTSGLGGLHVLWEVESWTLSERPSLAGDPALLKWIGGDLWAVLAVWDLTPLECA